MEMTETELLKDAFSEFTRASDSIINYYHVLETQIRILKEEVEYKNRELERAREYLENILNSIPLGVIVYDKDSITFSNKVAERIGFEKILTRADIKNEKAGLIKNGKGYYRWKRDGLQNGFKGKEVLIIEDVTEFEKMKERLERDERLKAMGEMAARIAHEIKNPLGSMELFLSMLTSGKIKTKDKKYIEYIRYGIQTIDRIINNILSYTRPKALALKEEKIGKVLEEILDFMKPSIESRNISVTYHVDYDGSLIFDPDMMKLVIMNLISNAIDAIKERGVIKIEVKKDEKHIIISIMDNGCGMNEEVIKNIFNPFFTTKDKGVGLGLFIVHNIIQAHGGYIEVDSQEGAGTTFSIYLPRERIA